MEMQSKNYRKYITPVLMLIVGLVVGWAISTSTHQHINSSTNQEINTSTTWTCSMHPSVRQSEPGQCPICGMDLIPLANDDDGGDPMEVRMSESAMKLANIQTTIVNTSNSVKEIKLNGKIQADERRKSSQAAHIPGRIEQLLVNFTGEYVQKGQTIAQVYSPELVTAQQELFEANKIKDAQPALFAAAREKLKNWKFNDKQINAMLESGKTLEHFPLLADVSGVVLDRRVNVGDYVMRGAPIYDVADLNNVWVLFDVYESDIQWVKKNSEIEFTVQSLPGEKFKNKISFIDPVLNPATRVATARVEMTNPGMRLKPEMFVSATIKSDFKGGMDISVPKSAVMWTGERSIVYLKKTTDAGVAFQMREVTLGASLGDSYIIKEGLENGDEIVTHGTFTIDAAAQLAGKPSMMSPEQGNNPKSSSMNDHSQMGVVEEVNEQFKNQLSALLAPYLALKDDLVKTNATDASAAARNLRTTLEKVDMALLS
ncbi:MAG: efflux RND transporter periplasmic adaptor subunit, partial [Cyclobacteriaceae bacterium]